MKTKKTISTVTETVMEIDTDTLRSWLKGRYPALRGIPFSLYVEVPGGGDWSHMNLDLDDSPLMVKYTTREHTEEQS